MAYADSFLRAVFIHSVYNTDTAVYGLTFIRDGGASHPIPIAVPEAFVTASTTYIETPGLFSEALALQTIKLNLIGTDGRYVADDTVLTDLDDTPNGVVARFPPAQQAYAVTTRSSVARGRAHAGRFYLPLPAVALGASGTLTDIDLNTFVTPTRNFLNALEAALPGWQLGIVSNLGAGAERRVEALGFGRVYDTIRSRRNKMDEDPFVIGLRA